MTAYSPRRWTAPAFPSECASTTAAAMSPPDATLTVLAEAVSQGPPTARATQPATNRML